MPTITRLQVQRRRKDRVSVHVDGAYAFSVPVDVGARLATGQQLSDDDLAELRDEGAYRWGLDRALRYLAFRPRSKAEVERYLRGRDEDDDTVARVVDRLTAIGAVDDVAFAEWWVENRITHRPRGRFALRSELTARGVDRDVIAEAIADVDDVEGAMRVALDKAPRYADHPREVFNRRLAALLARRGFGGDSVRNAVREAWRRSTKASGADTAQ